MSFAEAMHVITPQDRQHRFLAFIQPLTL